MTQPVYHDTHTTTAIQAFPLPQFMTRTRREVDTKDAINARHFENWQTRGAYGIMNRPDLTTQSPLFDMAPNDSRQNSQSFRSQPRFDADSYKGGQNPYFDKYDTASDARNMTRELRASVYEDKRTGYAHESHALLQRNMDHRWLHPVVAEEQSKAAILLRPKQDDIRLFYHNQAKGTEKGTTTAHGRT